ncbi:ParB/RepB/Spo0J family partition protein [Moraxella nasovis]|uniref:ParB/RepB/Spo0J family partition protein n=1 Tax=Moraxella nasovis TaxID=2904121 RepID=UPI001F6234D6|nr:ParB/RepB/Spo0J family partition protein [Moraxella nasovis]UNU73461.1 ParB/RepB/Spo0J family partition protein [Moraxella nasovis]
MKKRGLGARRGLDALINSVKTEKKIAQAVSLDDKNSPTKEEKPQIAKSQELKASLEKSAKKTTKPKKLENINITVDGEQVKLIDIDPHRLQSGKYQPRKVMDEVALNELAESIKQHGVMQPIVIRPLLSSEDKNNDQVTHEIIAGERRWRAAKIAGLKLIPAIERVLSDEIAIALALIENIQREDLNVLEQAVALQRFHTEFGMSHAMIADVVGKARATVTNLLRLNNLHDTVKEYMTANQLDMGHARTLLALSTKQQPIIAKKIIDAKMTVRDAEKLVKSILNPEPLKSDSVNSHEITRLNQKISDMLGASTKLKQNKTGKGSLEIFFHDDEELRALLAQLNVSL